jgi:4-hydroxybenzoate polyprenyltransferase
MLLAPIIDLIVTGGAKVGYFKIYTLHDLLYGLFSWIWSQHSAITLPGVTTGIIVEVSIVFIFLSFYVYIKSRSIIKTIFSFIVFYLIGFFMGSLPSLINLIFNIIGLGEWTIQKAFLNDYSSGISRDWAMSMLLLFIITILSLILFYLYNKKKFSYFFRYLSKTRVIHYLIILNVGISLAIILNLHGIYWSYTSLLIIILANLVVLLSWILAKVINDYFDKTEDSISNKNNPFLNNELDKKEILFVYSIISLLVLLISYTIGNVFFFFTILTLGISIIYSCPPLRLKRTIFLSHLCIGIASGFVFLQGFFLVSKNIPLSGLVTGLFLLIILVFFLGSHIKDIKDYSGDRKGKIITLPTLLGEKKSKLIISVIISLEFFLSIIILGLTNLIPVAILFSAIILYLLNKRRYSETLIFVTYFIFFIIICINIATRLLMGVIK